MPIPFGIDWLVWRLCVDHKGNLLRAPVEIEQGWSLEAVMDAHAVMDMVDLLQAEANKPAPAPKAKRPR